MNVADANEMVESAKPRREPPGGITDIQSVVFNQKIPSANVYAIKRLVT